MTVSDVCAGEFAPGESMCTVSLLSAETKSDYFKEQYYLEDVLHVIQWNLGIRDTHGTAKNCPEF